MKFAAIDIGSNAIRLLVEEVRQGEHEIYIEKVSLTRVPIRMGEDVFTKGKISKDKIKSLVKAMKAFWYLMDIYETSYYRACATSAMREAKNAREVISRVKKEANIEIELLSGDDEAGLIFSNFFNQHLDVTRDYLYIDVGGGSTEITLIRQGKRIRSKSFPVGAVRMLSGNADEEIWSDIKKWMQNPPVTLLRSTAIGTGGNINTIFKLQGKKPGELLTYKEINELHRSLVQMTVPERIMRIGLKPDRADVIVPAAEIYLRIMEFADVKEMLVPKIGLADGMILEMFERWKKGELK